LPDGQSWLGGYLGQKPWSLGRPSPYIRPPWLIVLVFTVVLVGSLYVARLIST